MLKLMNAQRLSALAAITHGGAGSITGAMSMIADIVRVEIDWQLFVMRPSSSLNPVATSARAAASEPRSRQTDTRPGIPHPASAPPVGAGASPKVVVPGTSSQQRDRHHPLMKRKRSMAEVFEAGTQVETQSPRPPPLKRTKSSSNGIYGSYYHPPPYCPVPPRRSTALEAKGGGGQEQAVPRRPPTPRLRLESRPAPKLVPYCGLWERLGGRNTPSFFSDDHDEDRGRPPRRRL
jgi:hypothetical protein